MSIANDFHVGLGDGQVFFFNDTVGPYQGSIIGLADDEGNISPKLLRIGARDFPGVYYRYFGWADSTLWTLELSLLWPIGVYGLPAAFWMWCRRRKRVASPTQ
jgi:hypothetical protein